MKIVIMSGGGEMCNAAYNYLIKFYEVELVIIEKQVDRKFFLKKRIKKLGVIRVLGQILFNIFIQKPLKITSKNRIGEITNYYKLDYKTITDNKILRVDSINDEIVKHMLQKINPDAIVVFGTRIITDEILNACKVPYINMHMGITPLYRGVHGGYWALASDDAEHCGVTVHIVDKGIDTGSIIAQKEINIGENDNFITYPYLQFGEGLKLYKEALDMIDSNSLKTYKNNLPSKLWTYPTIIEYVRNRIKRKVK